jgi:predicted dehydrogenase
MATEIGFGIVGAGLIGKVHAEAILAIPGARLVAVCGRDATKTAEFAARFGATAYANYDEFLTHPGLHVVNVCTPSGIHAEQGIAAARAGKHVLVEKPIETTLEKADALIVACEAAGVKLGVIFQSRFLPAVRRIKQALDENRLGKLMVCDAIVKWYRAPEYYADSWHGTLKLDGGGALINQAIHTVDLLRWFAGPVAEVVAFKSALRYPHIEAEDTLVGSLRFASGALGVLQATTSVKPGFKRRIELSGERGTIILDGDAISVWDIDGETAAPSNDAQLTDGSANPAAISNEGHRMQITDMLEAVRDDLPPLLDGRAGRASLEVVTAVYRAANSGQLIKL